MSDNFEAEVPFTEDAEFKELERALQLRQEQESKALEERQMEQRIQFGKHPGITRQQLEENYERQLREREAQSGQHKAEYERYAREYHDAKVMREEMQQREAERALKPEEGEKRQR